MTNELDTPQSENVEEEETTLESNEVEETNDELAKAKSAFNDQKIRAEKAEKELKALKGKPEKKEPTVTVDSNMSIKDIRALQDVHDDDVDEVVEYAKFKGLSIAEAKQDVVMSTMLKTNAELRATSNATNTGKGNRSSKSTAPEHVVEAHQAGKEIDPEKLAEAEMAIRMKGRTQQ